MNPVTHIHNNIIHQQNTSEFPGRDFDKSPTSLKIGLLTTSIFSAMAAHIFIPHILAITNPHVLLVSAVVTFVLTLKIFSSVFKNLLDEMHSVPAK